MVVNYPYLDLKGNVMGKKWWQNNKKQKNKTKKCQASEYNFAKGKQMSDNNEIAVGKVLTDDEFEKVKAQHDVGGAFKKGATARQNCWDAGIEILSSCDKMKAPQYHIEFCLLARQKINKLKAYYPRLEWLAYLVGVVDRENNKVTVEDLVIPDSQQVTTASVYNVEYGWGVLPDGKQIIGVIHSHHAMGAFFSGTDDAYINQNHDVSIVVATAKGREIKSQVRVKVPCGSYILAEDITYSVKYPQVLDEDAFEAEFKDKIKTYTPIVTYVGYGGNYLGNSSRGYSGRGMTSRYHGNTYGGRGAGNPPRQSYLGYDSEEQFDLWDELEDYQDPDDMDAEEVRECLLEYYSEEDIDEFMRDGIDVAREELRIVQNLCKEGIDIELNETEIVYETDGVWGSGDDVDTNTQTGVPLDSIAKPWTTKEDISEDDSLYKRVEAKLESEGFFKDMTDGEKHDIIVKSIESTLKFV